MNNKRLMKVLGLLLVIGLLTVISPLTSAQARTTDMFSISDWTIDGLVVNDSGRRLLVLSPEHPHRPLPAEPDNCEWWFAAYHSNRCGQSSVFNRRCSNGATITKTNNRHAHLAGRHTAQGPDIYNFTCRYVRRRIFRVVQLGC